MTTTKKRSDCPLSGSLDVFGDKWSLLIIRDLMFGEKCTYGDFLKSEERIATNILASRLQGLEENGIIRKTDHPDSKAKILYRLTQKGIDLLPVLVEIYLWAGHYFSIPDNVKVTLEKARKDKDGFVKSRIKELKKQHL